MMKIRERSLSTSSTGCSRRRKEKEDEAGLLFPVEHGKVQQDCYLWHQLQLPSPKACPTYIPPIGPLPKDWKWGADFC